MSTNANKNLFEELQKKGYFLLPLPYRKKFPPPKAWMSRNTPFSIPENGNVAISTRGELGILITNDEASTEWAEERFGKPHVRSKRGGHWYFRNTNNLPNEGNRKTTVGEFEFHTNNKYALIPPSIHPSGSTYEWEKSLPFIGDLPEAPDLRDLFHPGGTHHDELLHISASLAGKGKSVEEIYSGLENLINTFPDPKAHPEKELREMAKSAFTKFHDSKQKKPVKPDMPESGKQEGDDIHVVISDIDRIYGKIHNGIDGVIVYQKADNFTDVLRYRGVIGPVVMIDGISPGVTLNLNNEKMTLELKDVIPYLKHAFSLNQTKTQKLIEIINSYVLGVLDSGNATPYQTSPISVVKDKVTVSCENRCDVAHILAQLRDFYSYASHPMAYISVFAWTLVAPLHDEMKRRSIKGIQTPLIIEAGKTKGGKTTLGNLFIGKGYGLSHDGYFYAYNRVYTKFTLMKHLGESNLPALIDDLPQDWIKQHKEDLKAYVQTGHFGDRGRSDQTLTEYRGRRSFIATINDDIRVDDDLAMSTRLLILWFNEENRQRKNKQKYDSLFDATPEGFMFELFRNVFEGKDMAEIMHEIEKLENVTEWINYGIMKINELCQKYGIEGFPLYAELTASGRMTNAMEIAQGFVEEWSRMKIADGIRYRSAIEGAFKVELKDDRIHIHFTPSAFKTLSQRLNLRIPYSNAANFLSNVDSRDDDVRVEAGGKPHSVRIDQYPLRVYTISISADDEPPPSYIKGSPIHPKNAPTPEGWKIVSVLDEVGLIGGAEGNWELHRGDFVTLPDSVASSLVQKGSARYVVLT